MNTEHAQEEKEQPRKNKPNRFKAFLIGLAALVGIGGTTAVKIEHDKKEKAVKRVNQEELEKARAKKEALLKRKNNTDEDRQALEAANEEIYRIEARAYETAVDEGKGCGASNKNGEVIVTIAEGSHSPKSTVIYGQPPKIGKDVIDFYDKNLSK